ncbi:MAG: DUF5312 family protein [Spirochaetaceae bacterium]|jgi:hypothetical protein|nr:DUF5312 family protein [Spirochaetaceae bacterium]
MASFFDRILDFFAGTRDPEAAKKRVLKSVVKNLTANKYSKFYKPKGGQAEPALAKFFYGIYRIIAPAQVFMQNAVKSAQLKQVVVEAALDQKQQDILNRLSPESIEERSKKTPPKELARQLREELAALSGAFDNTRINAADGCYNIILAFTRFVTFDFYFLLKKFDSALPERSFSRTPAFVPVRGHTITEAIKDFTEAAWVLDPDQDWRTALKVLKAYKGDMEVVVYDQWNRLLLQLRDVKRSGILELMIRHIDNNPFWQPNPKISAERITDAYLEAKRTEIEGAIETMINAKRNAKIGELVQTVFGDSDTSRLKQYTEKNSELYVKKNFAGFIHVRGLNYLKTFLLDYFKKDIREICDLLLIRGQWSSNVLSQQMSDGFHEIMAISEQLITFDDALADNGPNGSRLKASIVRVDRDKGQGKYIRLILTSVNEEAEGMILKSAQALILIGRNLKNVLDDCSKNPHELIMNWKELESASAEPLVQRITAIYKKMYCFVRILQLLVRGEEEE